MPNLRRWLAAAAVTAAIGSMAPCVGNAMEGMGGGIAITPPQPMQPPPMIVPVTPPIDPAGGVPGAPAGSPGTLDFGQLESTIQSAGELGQGRDNWWQRGVSGITPPFMSGTGGWSNRENSCVGAAEARARDIAAAIQKMNAKGQLAGHSVTVGTRNGYKVLGASFHTYTVVEVKDSSGKVVRTYEVDNYVGSTVTGTSVKQHPATDFDPVTGDSNKVQTIGAPPPAPSTGTGRRK